MFSFDFSPFSVPDWVLFYKASAFMALAVAREMYFGFGLNRLQPFAPSIRLAADQVIIILLMIACVYLRGPGSAFIYFQF
jgi:hypothetical protein